MNITKEERAGGWPGSFALHRLAILQSPDDNKMAHIVHDTLKDACAKGDISHATTTVTVQTTARRVLSNGIASSEYLGRGFAFGRNMYGERVITPERPQPSQPKDVTVCHVTASIFAAWLAVQHQAPSEHIAAWFAAVTVAEPVQDAGPLTYAAMVAERKRMKDGPWTAAQLDALKLEDKKRLTQAGVRERIAKDLGVAVQAISSKLDPNKIPKRDAIASVHRIRG
ncbi:MAG: hypothetical protein ACYCZ6_00995 [Polaromonas sp.]